MNKVSVTCLNSVGNKAILSMSYPSSTGVVCRPQLSDRSINQTFGWCRSMYNSIFSCVCWRGHVKIDAGELNTRNDKGTIWNKKNSGYRSSDVFSLPVKQYRVTRYTLTRYISINVDRLTWSKFNVIFLLFYISNKLFQPLRSFKPRQPLDIRIHSLVQLISFCDCVRSNGYCHHSS